MIVSNTYYLTGSCADSALGKGNSTERIRLRTLRCTSTKPRGSLHVHAARRTAVGMCNIVRSFRDHDFRGGQQARHRPGSCRGLVAAAHRRGCDRWRSLMVNESTNAEVPESLIANDELPVRERDARTALHRTLVSRNDAERDARRVRKQIRCRVLRAHSKIRRRHFNFPSGE